MKDKTIQLIDEFYEAVDNMLSKANEFMSDYDVYDGNRHKSVTRLKDKMKEMIVRGTNE